MDHKITVIPTEADVLISGDIAISKEHEGFKWANLKETKPEKLFKSGILEGINMYLGIK